MVGEVEFWGGGLFGLVGWLRVRGGGTPGVCVATEPGWIVARRITCRNTRKEKTGDSLV